MDMKKILQAFDGAASKPVQGTSDMKKFLSIINENANPYQPVEETAITSFEEGSVGGDANTFLIHADNINDMVMGEIDKIKINADPTLLKDLMTKFNQFMTAYHAVGKEILQPDMFDELPGDTSSKDNTDESVEQSVTEGETSDYNERRRGKTPKDLGSADAWYHRGAIPNYYGFVKGSPEYVEYMTSYREWDEGPSGGKQWESVEEAKDTVEKDKDGKVISWKHEGDWKNTDKKDPRGKVTHASDVARRKTEKMTTKEGLSFLDYVNLAEAKQGLK